ncbi:hypothetical protein [Streptomyces sp. HC307]|uniref:hypothetical protein n=1 Tax=Streptomyces flavusporus TaxID=3385496 RepID=UPI003916E024
MRSFDHHGQFGQWPSRLEDHDGVALTEGEQRVGEGEAGDSDEAGPAADAAEGAGEVAGREFADDTWQPEPLPVPGGGVAACRRLPDLTALYASQSDPLDPSARPAAQPTGSTR